MQVGITFELRRPAPPAVQSTVGARALSTERGHGEEEEEEAFQDDEDDEQNGENVIVEFDRLNRIARDAQAR